MSGVQVSLTLSDNRWQQAVNDLLAAGKNLRGPLAEIGEYLVSETQERFATSTDPDGNHWAGVQRSGRPLWDFGHLMKSIEYQTDGHSLEVGSDLVYAAIHQFGGPAGRNKSVTIEARPYLGINQDNEHEIGQILADLILEAFAA